MLNHNTKLSVTVTIKKSKTIWNKKKMLYSLFIFIIIVTFSMVGTSIL